MLNSALSGKPIRPGEEIQANEIRDGILQLILEEFPEFAGDQLCSMEELNQYRRLYLARLIEQERGELERVDRDVMDAIRNNSILTEQLEEEFEAELTIGERMADHIAEFGGSWTFIIVFFCFILGWIAVNTLLLATRPVDPYPFILLNLMLSCLAAIQAPIIMMSQNRQEQKDRRRAEHDYKINLKAEIEIKLLSEKIDHLIVHQNKKLIEIQQIQVDYLEDVMKQIKQRRDLGSE